MHATGAARGRGAAVTQVIDACLHAGAGAARVRSQGCGGNWRWAAGA